MANCFYRLNVLTFRLLFIKRKRKNRILLFLLIVLRALYRVEELTCFNTRLERSAPLTILSIGIPTIILVTRGELMVSLLLTVPFNNVCTHYDQFI